MATMQRVYMATPHGGVCIELHYMNNDLTTCDEKDATCCVIRECDANGMTIYEAWGGIKKNDKNI